MTDQEPIGHDGRLSPVTPGTPPLDDHAQHDRWLVVRVASHDDDLTPPTRPPTPARCSPRCAECAALVGGASRPSSMPPPSLLAPARPRDFRLTPAQAERACAPMPGAAPAGWLASPRGAVAPAARGRHAGHRHRAGGAVRGRAARRPGRAASRPTPVATARPRPPRRPRRPARDRRRGTISDGRCSPAAPTRGSTAQQAEGQPGTRSSGADGQRRRGTRLLAPVAKATRPAPPAPADVAAAASPAPTADPAPSEDAAIGATRSRGPPMTRRSALLVAGHRARGRVRARAGARRGWRAGARAGPAAALDARRTAPPARGT